MKYFELFSGVGGFRQALRILGNDNNIEFDCVGFAEIDPYARDIYKNYFKPGEDEVEIANIIPYRERLSRGLPVPTFPGKTPISLDMGMFDLLVGDIPCEKYKDTVGLLNEVLWVLDVCSPSYVMLEAPKNITTYDKGNSMQHIIGKLSDLGYYCFFTMLNAKDYSIPQVRERVYIFGTKYHVPSDFEFCDQFVRELYRSKEKNTTFQYATIHDILTEQDRYSSSWVNPSSLDFIFATTYQGKKLYPSINLDPIMSIKPGSAKIQRANADNYFSEEFIESHGAVNGALDKTPDEWKKLKVRRLAINEAVLCQGFGDEFVKSIERRYIPETVLYKVIGSSTCVNTAYAALDYVSKMLNWK